MSSHSRSPARAAATAAVVASLALGPVGCALPGSALSPRQIFDRTVPSIFRIEASSPSGTMIGTGFAISETRIATNLHVIDGASDVVLQSRDGLRLRARRVIAVDERQDLVILETDARDLPPLAIADSDALLAGDRLYAIGSPLGLDYTITDGLFSGRRDIDSRGGLSMLQVSVPLSQGSSGGPLLDERGRVVGIATLVFSEEPFGLGIPSNVLTEVALVQTRGERFEEFASRRGPRSRQSGPDRRIPVHPVELLSDCSPDQIEALGYLIVGAIQRGAPAYNRGSPEDCFRIYEGTALRLGQLLTPTCRGGREALEAGLARAETLASYDEKAWAMRDTFDGLIDVIERYLQESPRN